MDKLEQMDKYIEEHIKKYNYKNYLYHYTSMPVLYNMFKNKEIWFGNTASMNDSKEVKYFIELLRDELRGDIQTKVSKERMNDFDNYFSRTLKRIDNEYPYAMCLSKLKDDAAQWERYGDNACGVCIVFNTKKLMRIFYDCHMLFGAVYYGGDIKQHEHYKILYNYFLTGKLEGFSDEIGQVDNIIACGYIHKHNSFESEQEVRAVNLWNHIPKYAKIETECISGIIKQVMKVDIEKCCKEVELTFDDVLAGIIVGPKSRQSIGSLRTFALECGFTKWVENISKSECPLQ